jgi:hypothetical protein
VWPQSQQSSPTNQITGSRPGTEPTLGQAATSHSLHVSNSHQIVRAERPKLNDPARDAWTATKARWPGSLQRMVEATVSSFNCSPNRGSARFGSTSAQMSKRRREWDQNQRHATEWTQTVAAVEISMLWAARTQPICVSRNSMQDSSKQDCSTPRLTSVCANIRGQLLAVTHWLGQSSECSINGRVA